MRNILVVIILTISFNAKAKDCDSSSDLFKNASTAKIIGHSSLKILGSSLSFLLTGTGYVVEYSAKTTGTLLSSSIFCSVQHTSVCFDALLMTGGYFFGEESIVPSLGHKIYRSTKPMRCPFMN